MTLCGGWKWALSHFTHEEAEKLPSDGAGAKHPVFLIPPRRYFSAVHTVSFAGWAVVTGTPLNGNSWGNPVPLGWSPTGREEGQRALLDVDFPPFTQCPIVWMACTLQNQLEKA